MAGMEQQCLELGLDQQALAREVQARRADLQAARDGARARALACSGGGGGSGSGGAGCCCLL